MLFVQGIYENFINLEQVREIKAHKFDYEDKDNNRVVSAEIRGYYIDGKQVTLWSLVGPDSHKICDEKMGALFNLLVLPHGIILP